MTVFISRELAPDSDFRQLLVGQGWQVNGQSLVTLTALPFESIPPADWFFFTSQQAVRFFFQQLEKQVIPMPAAKWAALGAITASVLTEYVASVDFIGTGAPETTAPAFRTVALQPSNHPDPRYPETQEKRNNQTPLSHRGGAGGGVILFPAARHATHTLRTLLSPEFQCVHLEIYDNQPVPNPPFRNDDVLVFTSPMNAAAYFSKHRLQEMQRVVAIGGTTAAALLKLGIAERTVAIEATETGLAEAVLKAQ